MSKYCCELKNPTVTYPASTVADIATTAATTTAQMIALKFIVTMFVCQ